MAAHGINMVRILLQPFTFTLTPDPSNPAHSP